MILRDSLGANQISQLLGLADHKWPISRALLAECLISARSVVVRKRWRVLHPKASRVGKAFLIRFAAVTSKVRAHSHFPSAETPSGEETILVCVTKKQTGTDTADCDSGPL